MKVLQQEGFYKSVYAHSTRVASGFPFWARNVVRRSYEKDPKRDPCPKYPLLRTIRALAKATLGVLVLRVQLRGSRINKQ